MEGPPKHTLAELVARLWQRGEQPDLAMLIETASDRSLARVIDAAVEDAEQRARRGLPYTLEHYRTVLPAHAGDAELARALLMLECSCRVAEASDAVLADMLRRFPELFEEVSAVVEMVALMRSSGPLSGENAAELFPGASLGKYRLVGWLGAGTFGEVWSAWDSTLERYVALKLLPSVGAGGSNLSAVLREAKSAAAIDHENVVKVHDAGEFGGSARCYIDTQLAGDPAPTLDDPKRVEPGRSLSAVVADLGAGGLSVREACRVMALVCGGAAAAHARGIVHRDIKPSNILVTGSGRPMLSDFGLSLLAGPMTGPAEGASAPSETVARAGRVTGTPAFMAPEQARGEPATPASDVYSLGATLRFALTGKLPFEPSGKFSRDAVWDVIEQVRAAKLRPICLERPDLPQDVSAICDKAMAADPAGRYLSAEALAADLRAYLQGRPVSARPAGVVRTGAMWAKRNRAVVGLVAAMLLLGSLGLWRYIVNIAHERDRAVTAEAATAAQLKETEKARASAEAVNAFLQSVMGAADPSILGKDAKMLDAIRLSAATIEAQFRDQPLVEADVRESIGMVYTALDQARDADRQLSRSLEIRSAALGPDAPPTIRVRHALASVRWRDTNSPEAAAEVGAATEQARRVLPMDDPVRLAVEMDYAAYLGGNHRFAEAREVLKEVVASFERRGEPESPQAMTARRLLAGSAGYSGDVDEAVAQLTALIDLQEHKLGKDSFERYQTMYELAGVVHLAGRVEDSALWHRRVLEGLRPLLPPGNAVVYASALSMTSLYAGQLGRFQDGLDLFRPVFDEYVAGPQRESDKVAMGELVLAICYIGLKRYPEAEQMLLEGRKQYAEKSAQQDDIRARFDRRLVELYQAWGRPDEAAKYRTN